MAKAPAETGSTKSKLTPEQVKQQSGLATSQSKYNAAKTPLAQAQALIEIQNARLSIAEGNQAALSDLSNELKTNVVETAAAAKAARTSATATMAVTGSIVNPFTGNVTAPPTSSRQLIRQKLVDLGFPPNIIDGSISFVKALVDDGDFENDPAGYDSAVQILYNYKDFTTKKGNKLTSPFYAEFTSLGEGLLGDKRKGPKYLMEFALSAKDLVAKTGFSTRFASQDSLKKYIQNGVRITDLDERFAAATLKTAEADPNNIKALQAMGFINSAQDLKDFYADPEIGQDELNRRRTNVAFAKQAIKRADSGIAFSKTRIEQLAAGSGNELEAETTASQGYETIAQQLNPLTKIEGIYGRRAGDYAGKSDTEIRSGIQTMLEEEQFRGTASELRKRRTEEEELAFQRKSGTIGANRMSGGSLGGKSKAGLY